MRPEQRQLVSDLWTMRAQYDREVTNSVLRGEWDHAAAAARKADEVTTAILRAFRVAEEADADST